ncbi:extensin-like [Iris pallida]|uniref:Extensin-like n=1 Tax=Iris pallida TaxID=29817 RepID=A0AAX6FTR2_IRIPA|nr:extensin-like [Iris pallida]
MTTATTTSPTKCPLSTPMPDDPVPRRPPCVRPFQICASVQLRSHHPVICCAAPSSPISPAIEAALPLLGLFG